MLQNTRAGVGAASVKLARIPCHSATPLSSRVLSVGAALNHSPLRSYQQRPFLVTAASSEAAVQVWSIAHNVLLTRGLVVLGYFIT